MRQSQSWCDALRWGGGVRCERGDGLMAEYWLGLQKVPDMSTLRLLRSRYRERPFCACEPAEILPEAILSKLVQWPDSAEGSFLSPQTTEAYYQICVLTTEE